MVDQHIHPEPEPLSSSETAGKILASARMGWDLTVDEVATNLNLSADTIRALEKDEYEKLPGYTFVKGYIRSYANLLRLNPDEVISTVHLEPERHSEIPALKGSIKLKGKTYGRPEKKRGSFFKFIIFLFLLAGLSLFGLNQWSKLDTKELAEFLKLPLSDSPDTDNSDDNEIIFPSNGSTQNESNQNKEALIRIE